MRLEAELDRRERQVDASDNTPIRVEDRVLSYERRQTGRVEANREELLEPGLGHPTFVGYGVEEAQQCAGAGLSGPVQALCCRAQLQQVDVSSAGVGQCLADPPSVSDDRAEVGERPGDRGAWQAADHGDVSLVKGGHVVDHGVWHANPKRSGDARLDDGHTGVIEAVEAVQSRRRAM